MTAAREQIDAELRNAWLAELAAWWAQFDHDYLGGAMRRPRFELLSGDATLGRWDRATRTIGISITHIREAPWRVVLETLRHEMAHQYADEQMGAIEPPHGSSFRAACARLRVTPRASIDPGAVSDRHDEPGRSRLLRRIEKLLSLAGSPNENEAEAAFRKARRLLVEHGLELCGRDSDYRIQDLGQLKARHQTWEITLANILDRFFSVEAIWAHSYDATRAKRGTILRVFGTETALEMAGYVHSFLISLLERMWRSYRQARGLRVNRDRQRYYLGVLRGFEQKLGADERAMRDQEGLVPVSDPALDAFVRHHVPHVRTFRRGGAPRGRALADGERDGHGIVVSKPIGSPGEFGGLLEG